MEERVDFRVKSAITIVVIVVIMMTVGILVNKFQGGLTGAAVSGVACIGDAECNDGIVCTIDSCKNPGTENSFCSNSVIDYCRDGDNCCPAGCESSDNDC